MIWRITYKTLIGSTIILLYWDSQVLYRIVNDYNLFISHWPSSHVVLMLSGRENIKKIRIFTSLQYLPAKNGVMCLPSKQYFVDCNVGSHPFFWMGFTMCMLWMSTLSLSTNHWSAFCVCAIFKFHLGANDHSISLKRISHDNGPQNAWIYSSSEWNTDTP